MSIMDKKQLIKDIEGRRGSRVLTYVTSDRPGPLNARVAMDVIPIFSKQLRAIGHVSKIDLFLYSTGGDTMVPWRLVSMIRGYCDTFSVLVPYKAHSAATMIALGADEIVMSDLSELSPIDPSTANAFNPADPQNPAVKIPVSVEDVVSFMDLAKEKFGIKEDENLAKIFMKFVDAVPQIHPLALGNVNRTHNLIRLLAKRLLKSHKQKMSDGEIEKVVEFFTEKLYSHHYFIGSREAKEDLGLKPIKEADADLARNMTELYELYVAEMGLGQTQWNPETELGANVSNVKKTYTIASIESAEIFRQFDFTFEFKRQQFMAIQQGPQGQIQIPQERIDVRIAEQGWR